MKIRGDDAPKFAAAGPMIVSFRIVIVQPADGRLRLRAFLDRPPTFLERAIFSAALRIKGDRLWSLATDLALHKLARSLRQHRRRLIAPGRIFGDVLHRPASATTGIVCAIIRVEPRYSGVLFSGVILHLPEHLFNIWGK